MIAKYIEVSATWVNENIEQYPSINTAIAKNGNIYVTWTQALPTPYSGYIWFSRSSDGGKTFSQPSIVHQDRAEITHRFDALAVSPSGRIYVAWVDKRDLIAAKKAKQSYDGAAIYYAEIGRASCRERVSSPV